MQFLKPEEYQGKIAKLYFQVSSVIHETIPGARVEHVGSSAIAGAVSKGDLDVFVEVPLGKFDEALKEFISLGFTVKTESDHSDDFCMLEGSIFGMDVGIQLNECGADTADFIKFRDLLNADQSLVQKYNEMKLSCTGFQADDYRAVKAKFIEDVLARGRVQN